MLNKEMVTVVVQAILSILIVIGALFLIGTGRELEPWLVNLIVFVVGAWFGLGTVSKYNSKKEQVEGKVMRIRLRPDGTWERVSDG